MTAAPASASGLALAVGTELPPLRRTYTRERWAWGESAIDAGAGDEDRSFRPERSIHSDERLAAEQGLPGRIATGALLVNWISGVLVRHFGLGYIERGALQVKFVSPVLEGEVVTVQLRVRSLVPVEGGTRCELDVSLESSSGATCVAGEASALVPGS